MSIPNTNELIVYSNSRNGLGIRVLGAKRPTNKSGIYIKQLFDDGLAQRDGRLKVKKRNISLLFNIVRSRLVIKFYRSMMKQRLVLHVNTQLIYSVPQLLRIKFVCMSDIFIRISPMNIKNSYSTKNPQMMTTMKFIEYSIITTIVIRISTIAMIIRIEVQH